MSAQAGPAQPESTKERGSVFWHSAVGARETAGLPARLERGLPGVGALGRGWHSPLLLAAMLAAAAVVASGVASCINSRAIAKGGGWVAHTLEVRAELAEVLSLLKDAERGHRGYLLTNRIEDLAPYEAAAAHLPERLDRLEELTAEQPAQQARAREIRRLVMEELTLVGESVRRTQDGDPAGALEAIMAGRCAQTMEDAGTIAAAMRWEENRALKERGHLVKTAARRTTTFAATSTGLVLALLMAVYMTGRWAAERVREAANWLRVTLQSIGDAVIATDTAGRVRLMNPRAEGLTGWTAAEACGRPLAEVFRVVTEEDRRAVEDPVANILGDCNVVGLANHTLLLARDGQERPIAECGAPIRDEKDGIRGVVLVFKDVSQERCAARKLEQLAAELEERVAERTRALTDANADLEAFSYTIAHDLRAPVRNMHSLAEALVEDYAGELPAEAREYTQRIVGAAERMDTLIKDLLGYARLAREAILPQPADLDAIVDAALAQMQPEIEERRARVEVHRPLGRVSAHRTTLEQVIANLIGNAIKFVERGKAPVVHLRAEKRGSLVRLWVEDNGLGIAPEHTERIFRVFERLHAQEAYPGTGVGLAIVRKGTERMGGASGVETEPGRGSRFWIDLPALEAA